ncbi:MAG TPA: penicillin-binding transpeptidase domain-containing protein [Candidatus Limnocylindria bacterium]|nr:penicillin-binding transpeptidase domain-containing protein [Candidatus Limnocylindria bacterium]
MIATNVRRLGFYLVVAFALVSGSLVWWQVVEAPALARRTDNPEVIAARRSLLRGTIFDANGEVLASSQVIDGLSRRTYADPAFTHVIGYSSLRFGSTGLERAFEDLLVGQADPNPIRDLVNDVLDRQPQPRDLSLTVDRRLQDFAAAELGSDRGAVVALDPITGEILAMASSPTFDATPLSGDPNEAQAPMDALREDPAEPLLPRARQGRYVPGSIMKVFTGAAALDAGVITPETTYPDQPEQELNGFVVEGFTIREHDLGGVQPALWPLSEALQVSSNIFFAHVGLELGAEPFVEYARRFGFCAPIEIGTGDRALSVAPSYVTAPVENDCGPFSGEVELASASFGQGSVVATPVQMALVAAAVAADGVLPQPFVVRDVRAHTEDGTRSETVLDRFSSAGGTRILSVEAARAMRSAMVDAVNGELGRIYAGQGDITLYGIGGHLSAGKTGTAQLGGEQAPHSWFIGFAPAEESAASEIAVAVLVESGGSGSGRAAAIAGRVMAEWLRLSGAAGN